MFRSIIWSSCGGRGTLTFEMYKSNVGQVMVHSSFDFKHGIVMCLKAEILILGNFVP